MNVTNDLSIIFFFINVRYIFNMLQNKMLLEIEKAKRISENSLYIQWL